MAIVMYDEAGRMLMQIKESKGTGRKTIDLPLTKFGAGKYYIRVLNGQKTVGTAELLKL
jgi:hypothetical protein